MSTPLGLILDLGDRQPLYIPWQQIPYAFFGKNGVGKSRTLAAVRQLFNGGEGRRPAYPDQRSACSVIVEAPLPGKPDSTGRQSGGSFLQAYLSHVLPTTDFYELGELHEVYEQHMKDVGRQWTEDWDVAPLLWEQARHQRYFEISRDSLGEVVVRPCYLESPDYPELSASLAKLHRDDDDSLWHSPLFTDEYETLDGGRICFATVSQGTWYQPPWITPSGETGYTCVDLRTETVPDTQAVGEHLARMLEAGDDLKAWAREVSQEATRQLHRALQTSAGLHLKVPRHADLLRGDRVEWMATRSSNYNVTGRPELFPFEELSTAERTWSLLAIERATMSMVDTLPNILLIDEPEQGLHRAAERQALGWLAELGQDEDTWVWCATHSPTLLGDERIAPVAVREELHASDRALRRSWTTRLLGSSERAELVSLGLSTTDLLSTRRGFLLVEGSHDETVLTELIGKELSDLSIEILPLRGASKLPGAIEARTLFDFTDALVLALLDGIPAEGLSTAWAEARKYVDAPETAHRVLSEGIEWPTNTESEWMKEWLMRSITRGRGRHARVEPLGVSKADIIEYLPVHAFVPSADSWENLRAEHAERLEASKRTPKDFKAWLTKAHRADFSVASLRQACGRMDHIPHEFTNLLNRSEKALREYEIIRPM